MCKHKREETRRHRWPIGHVTWPLSPQKRHKGELEKTTSETLFEQHMLCVGKDTLSQSWDWADFLYTASCTDPQNPSNPRVTDDLPYSWTQHPRPPGKCFWLLQLSLMWHFTILAPPPHLLQVISALLNMLCQSQTWICNSKPVLSVLSADRLLAGLITVIWVLPALFTTRS